MKLRDAGSKTLFRGQRKARKHHECEDCGRPICPGEYYWTKVVIFLPNLFSSAREVLVRTSCCKEV